MRTAIIGLTVVLTAFMGTLTVAAQHHQWSTSRPDTRTLRPSTLQPRAVLGPANGLYCPDLSDGAFGVHDLGWVPSGMTVEVNVESYSDNEFDPVAAVVVASLGLAGGNSIKTNTFFDNDSGGGKDARISFVTPQAGTYVLFVADNSGKLPGCYRYQASIR